jgi:tRNA threonylcarbamoyladenosine biosynthesis protein TsaB
MALLLAFDTSASATSVAVCDDTRVLAEEDVVEASARHAELLLPTVQRCLSGSGIALGDIDALGVGIGPGSFTGLRVGVATAKGLGLCLKKPVYGVVSLTALAQAASEHGTWLAPLLDAFKGEVFGALYRVTSHGVLAQIEPFHAAPATAIERIVAATHGEPVTLLGAGYRRYATQLGVLPGQVSVLPEAFDWPLARHIGRLAHAAYVRGQAPELAQLSPLYVRDSDAQLPKVPLRV